MYQGSFHVSHDFHSSNEYTKAIQTDKRNELRVKLSRITGANDESR